METFAQPQSLLRVAASSCLVAALGAVLSAYLPPSLAFVAIEAASLA